ncbi:MAG: hypothetical protein ABI083_15075 [Lapillicoccus sp.]
MPAPSGVRIVGAPKGNRSVAIASQLVSFASLADDTRGRFERLRFAWRLISSPSSDTA